VWLPASAGRMRAAVNEFTGSHILPPEGGSHPLV
jgi:hypothetical protein